MNVSVSTSEKVDQYNSDKQLQLSRDKTLHP